MMMMIRLFFRIFDIGGVNQPLGGPLPFPSSPFLSPPIPTPSSPLEVGPFKSS